MSDDTVDELKERIQQLEDELQQLKDEKRQDATDSAEVDEEIEEVRDQIRDEADHSGMSRRKFMKAIAGGGAALGAAAMVPSAAALDIESNNPFSYNDNFSVDTQGNLNLQGNNVTNAGSVGASSVAADKIYTVSEHTLAAIKQAIDNHQYVRLEPGATYDDSNGGVSTIDFGYQDENRRVRLDAHGAKMSTSADVLFDIDNSSGSEDPILWRGRLNIHGGSFEGPGAEVTGSAAIRARNTFGCNFYPDTIGGFESGVVLRNTISWCEECEVHFSNGGGPTADGSLKHTLRVLGGVHDSNWSGTGSFRNIKITIPFGAPRGDETLICSHGANIGSGEVEVLTNIPPNGIGWRCRGGKCTGTIARFNVESGGDETVVQFEKAANGSDPTPPIFHEVTNVGSGTTFDTSNLAGYKRLTHVNRAGINEVNSSNPKVLGVNEIGPGVDKVRERHIVPSSGSDYNYVGWLTWDKSDETQIGALARNGNNAPVIMAQQSGQPIVAYNKADEGHTDIVSTNTGQIEASGGPVSVSAGGTTTVTTGYSDATARIIGESAIVWADADPGSAYGLDVSPPRWNGSEWEFDVTETEGNTAIDFNWRFLSPRY